MFLERARMLRVVSVTLDVALIGLAFGAALVLRAFHAELPILNRISVIPWTSENLVPSDYFVLLMVSTLAWISALAVSGAYHQPRSKSLIGMLAAYAWALLLAAGASAAAGFILKMGAVSRVFFGYYFALSVLLLIGKHIAVIAFLGRARHGKARARQALVVGNGKPAFSFADVLSRASGSGYNLVGVLLTKKIVSAEALSVPVLGTVADIDGVLERHGVDEVFLVGGARDLAEMAPLAQALIERGNLVSMITAMKSGVHGVRGRVTEFSGVPMLSFGPMPRDEVNDSLKRALDVTVSGVAAMLALPVGLLVVLAIKIFDPGPVLFSQERLGRGGRCFRVLKFRTMRVDAEERLRSDKQLYAKYVANDFKLPSGEDPRVTRLGAFLRRSSLDELPQLWNVLRGDMAVVGPRPIIPGELASYGVYAEMFLSARPGLTGLWQVSGRSSVAYPERAFMDLDYIASYNVFRDVSLLARTVPAVVQRTGAH